MNRVDPESVVVKSPQGTHSGYSMQTVVDDKNGLIVGTDVVNEANDSHQLAVQISGAEANVGRKCEMACADAGYSDIVEIERSSLMERSRWFLLSHRGKRPAHLIRVHSPIMLIRTVTCAPRGSA